MFRRVCGVHANYEDNLYIFLECLRTVQVWEASNVWAEISRALQQHCTSMDEVIILLLQCFHASQSEHFATIL